jgi:CheY-like chemotaxis protein
MPFREIPGTERTFVRVEMPRRDHHATRRHPSKKTIVVIDDESGLADILAATLLDVGYRVQTAWNGIVGLELLATRAPDLVILDYTMPLLDGAGVLTSMRTDQALWRIPVVMMSAMPESIVQERCHGYTAFVRKPFDVDAMLSVVQRALGGHQ